jgi:hypothetical protein
MSLLGADGASSGTSRRALRLDDLRDGPNLHHWPFAASDQLAYPVVPQTSMPTHGRIIAPTSDRGPGDHGRATHTTSRQESTARRRRPPTTVVTSRTRRDSTIGRILSYIKMPRVGRRGPPERRQGRFPTPWCADRAGVEGKPRAEVSTHPSGSTSPERSFR